MTVFAIHPEKPQSNINMAMVTTFYKGFKALSKYEYETDKNCIALVVKDPEDKHLISFEILDLTLKFPEKNPTWDETPIIPSNRKIWSFSTKELRDNFYESLINKLK